MSGAGFEPRDSKNKNDYLTEGYRQLNDKKYYKKISEPIFEKTAERVNEILFDLKNKKYISEKQYLYLKSPENPRPRQFYMLPKIHKPIDKWLDKKIPPGRPIISDCSSETYAISEYIDHFLQPLSNKHPSYIKDTYDFINKLKQTKVKKRYSEDKNWEIIGTISGAYCFPSLFYCKLWRQYIQK